MITLQKKTPVQLKDVESLSDLELKARQIVAGMMEGLHKSYQTGYNVEFKEYREYVPGNDTRQIDWKLFCRTERLFLKIKETETHVNGYVLVDCSASMDFRSKGSTLTKWQYAQQMASALMLFLAQQRDPVALAIAGSTLDAFYENTMHPETIRGMIHELGETVPAGSFDFDAVMRRLLPLIKKQSLVFILSDFYTDIGAAKEAVGHLRARGCECFFLHIVDPVETDFSIEEETTLVDLEDGSEFSVDPEVLRENYLKQFNQHVAALEDMMNRNHGVFLQMRTDRLPLGQLATYLRGREAQF
ncbi:MAG: DUF58 domain-containing protein [Opitutales bacterium]